MPLSQNLQLIGAILAALLVSFAYIRSVPTIGKVIEFNEYLEGFAFSVNKYIPAVSALDLAGSILSCKGYRQNIKSNKSWFESLVACTLMQFGGTTLTGVLLGQTPSWILSNTAFPALLLAWWLTFFCPFDLFWKLLNKVPGALFFIGIWAAVSAGHAVTSWGVDKAAQNASHVNTLRISRSVLTCTLAGTLSACGGGLLCDWLGLLRTKNAFTLTTTPSILVTGRYSSSATLTRSFWLAVLYVLLLNQHSFFPWQLQLASREAGHLIIVGLQVFNYILYTIFPTVDLFQSLSTFVLTDILIITPEVGPHREEVAAEKGEVVGDDGKKVKDDDDVVVPTSVPATTPSTTTKKKRASTATAATATAIDSNDDDNNKQRGGRSVTPSNNRGRRRSTTAANTKSD